CFILIVLPANVNAYKIIHDMVSPSGGFSQNNIIASSNMQPYSSLTKADLDTLFQKANELLAQGSGFKTSLSFYPCEDINNTPACGDDRLKDLLLYPDEDYETVGFIQDFQDNGIADKLINAIEIYALLANYNYPEDVISPLRESLRDLMIIYMVFADEFLIDALDFRISSSYQNPTADDYLNEQIGQLAKAVEYYQYAYREFSTVWSKPIWYTEIVGEYFAENNEENEILWDIFSLLCQRLSMSVREKVSRQRALGIMDPDEMKDELYEISEQLYLQTVAMAEILGEEQFSMSGGEQILTALNMISKQADNINENLNLLGYDERYVPLNDFESLYTLANATLTACSSLESEVKAEKRDYDYILDKVLEQKNSLSTSYTTELAELAGCSANLLSDEFEFCVECSGGDLYDCQTEELDPDAFEACVKTKVAGAGILGAKYRQIKDADYNLKLARLQFENIGKRIKNINDSVQNQIEIWKDYTGAQKTALDKYLDNMEGAVKITEIKSKEKVKDRETGETTSKTKTKTTQKTFILVDEPLELQIKKEKEVLDAALEFQIKNIEENTAASVKNLLLQQAESLIGIDMAVHNKNTMIAAYDAVMRRKENLLVLWRNNQDFVDRYWQQKLPSHRVIQSDLALQLTQEFNELAHLSYLATKALEYKYMEPMQNVDLGALGKINLTDIFKCQTVTDFGNYLSRLNSYNVMECSMETSDFSIWAHEISLAHDILGLPMDKNLNELEGFADYIDSEGNLKLTFTTYTHMFSFPPMANLKIWRGTVPCSSESTRGLTARLCFVLEPGSISPSVKLIQKGIQTFLGRNNGITEYYPIKTKSLMNYNDTAPMSYTTAYLKPFKKCLVYPYDEPDNSQQWTPAFTNRGVASEWELTLFRSSYPSYYGDVPVEQLEDIILYLHTIGYFINK
ncbi:MAG: hypothetical protein GY749_38990, partial [Desulfobacteraceae bacterium]|nr:hypothetical protein [Desulfobacteraceae bacterium]